MTNHIPEFVGAKKALHDKFDKLWLTKKQRNEAYVKLAKRLNCEPYEAHFSNIKTTEQLRKVKIAVEQMESKHTKKQNKLKEKKAQEEILPREKMLRALQAVQTANNKDIPKTWLTRIKELYMLYIWKRKK